MRGVKNEKSLRVIVIGWSRPRVCRLPDREWKRRRLLAGSRERRPWWAMSKREWPAGCSDWPALFVS